MDIGRIGIWTSYRPFGAERAGEAAKLVEQLGYATFRLGGSPHVPDVRPILEATSTLVAATGVEHTRSARARLGARALVAPEVACVVETDPARARAVARDYATLYLGLSNDIRNLLEFGFTEADFADGGSDRLIDAVIPHGSAEQIADVVRAHLDAGADHVCVQPLGERGIPRASWTALAEALL